MDRRDRFPEALKSLYRAQKMLRAVSSQLVDLEDKLEMELFVLPGVDCEKPLTERKSKSAS